jgi:hypothetical protein
MQMGCSRKFSGGKAQARRLELVYASRVAIAKVRVLFECPIQWVSSCALGLWFAVKVRLDRVQLKHLYHVGG